MNSLSNCLIALMCIPLFTYPQENTKRDSLLQLYNARPDDTIKVNLLDDLFWATHHVNPEEAKSYMEESIQLSRKINFPKGEANAHYKIGAGYFWNTGNSDSIRYHIKRSMKIYREIGREDRAVMARDWLGAAEYRDGNYEKAIEYYNAGIEYNESHGDYKGAAIVYGYRSVAYDAMGAYNLSLMSAIKSMKILDSLASVSMDRDMHLRLANAYGQAAMAESGMGNHRKALEYCEQATDHYKAGNFLTSLAENYNDMGSSYKNLGDYDEALRHYQMALDIVKDAKLPFKIGFVTNNIGDVYLEQGNYSKSIEVLEEAYKIQEKAGTELNVGSNLYNLGKAHIAIEKPRQALNYLNRAVDLWDSTEVSDNLAKTYLLRAEAYKKLNNYERVVADLERYQQMNDSIFNKTKSQQIEEMRIIYDTEKKEQQIALQENKIQILDQEAKIGNLQRILLAIGLLLSIIGFYAIRQKLKRSKAEKKILDSELAYKKKELTTHALHLAKKNEVLENLKQKAKELKKSENGSRGYQQLIQTINFDQQDDKNWENFTQYFEQVHKNFSSLVKERYPEVTKNELRFMALLKMNMSSKEIATILNISADGVKKARQRLRKKMNLKPEDSLENKVLAI